MQDPGVNGGGLTAHEIYVQMTGGPGVKALDAPVQAWEEESRREEERAERIRRIADKIQAGWQGSAADGAYGAAGPLAEVVMEAALKQKTSEALLHEQSASFQAAAGNLRPIEPIPPQSNVMNDLLPWETDLDRQIKKYQQDAQHNIDIYSRYDDQSLAIERRFPQEYPTITDTGGTVAVRPAGSEPPPGGGGYPPAGRGPDGGGGPNPGGGGPQPGEAWQPPQETGKSFAEEPGVPPGERPPTRVPPVTPPPGGGPGPGPVPGWPPVGPGPVRGGDGSGRPGLRGGGGGISEGGPGGRGGAEGGRGARGAAGDGSPRGGSEGGAGRGAGVRGGPGAEPGAGGRAGAGGLAAEEAAGRRGVVGARSGGAGGGFGPMGGGRGQGDDDIEHERKSYLQEPDPEAIFGSDEQTAPPVIGE